MLVSTVIICNTSFETNQSVLSPFFDTKHSQCFVFQCECIQFVKLNQNIRSNRLIVSPYPGQWHRRRIKTEQKAKVVAAVRGTEFIQSLATLDIFHQDDF